MYYNETKNHGSITQDVYDAIDESVNTRTAVTVASTAAALTVLRDECNSESVDGVWRVFEGANVDGVSWQVRVRGASQGARGQRTGMASPDQHAYEQREIREANAQITAAAHAPLQDRKEAQQAFFEAMRDQPDVVADRIGWLLDGNYGYGSMLLARRVLGSRRMNRPATLTQMIGVFEWQSPGDMTRAAWKKLSPGEKHVLQREVEKAILDAEASLED